MTDITSDLIQRLADELDTWMMAHHHGGVPPEIQHAATLVAEARALLSQPEPEGPTVMEIIALADEIEAEELGQVDLVRRALARYGRPAIQSEPEGLTEEEIEEHFQRWWSYEGFRMRPFNGEDQGEHTRRVSQIAWSNGAYVARWGRSAVEPETNGTA